MVRLECYSFLPETCPYFTSPTITYIWVFYRRLVLHITNHNVYISLCLHGGIENKQKNFPHAWTRAITNLKSQKNCYEIHIIPHPLFLWLKLPNMKVCMWQKLWHSAYLPCTQCVRRTVRVQWFPPGLRNHSTMSAPANFCEVAAFLWIPKVQCTSLKDLPP